MTILVLRIVAFLFALGTSLPTCAQVVGGGSGPGSGLPGPPNNSLQFNNNGSFGGYLIGSSFTTAGGVFNIGSVTGPLLAQGAAAFNLGPAAGDLAGTWPNLSLAVGSASRGVGNLGACLGGTLPNPTSLAASCVLTAMGTPGGDLGGTTYSTPLVTGLQGFPIASGVAPQLNSALTWNGTSYVPVVQAPGINQLTGAISAGPGTGSQIASLNAGVVTNANLVSAPGTTFKCNAGAGMAAPSDCPVTGGLAFNNGALQLATNLGTSQLITVGTNCWTVQNGIIASIIAGSCSAGTLLTADDGATILTADDAVTQLTAEGGGGLTPCASNLVLKFNVATGCNMITRAAAL